MGKCATSDLDTHRVDIGGFETTTADTKRDAFCVHMME